MNNFVITHLHTTLSNGVTNIDSVTHYDEYIKRAKELKMKAIAFTEHGNIFEWYKKKCCCEDNGIKYIHAEEFYVTKQLEPKVRDNYHVCLYALNYEGVKELNRLSSIAFEDSHKYYTPRISFEELINTSDNIAISTACLGGILGGNDDELKKAYIEFLTINKHRCFLEIQHHNVSSQKKYNETMYDIHIKTGISMIMATDTHALNDEHIKGRDIMQKAKKIYFDNESGWDLTFKSYNELIEACRYHDGIPEKEIIEAINNTNVLADMVEEFTLDTSYKYPHLWDNPLKTFIDKINEGIIRRGINKYDNYVVYKQRIKEELESYIHNNAIDFMLLMDDIISWCKSVDIEVGYGRGSVNGSIIAYILGITEMDSIKYGLNFQRFMNTERVSLADIDTDFPPSRLEDVRDYIYSKTGLHCCDIITFNTVALRGAIRDVARGIYSYSEEDIPEDLKIRLENDIKAYGQYTDWNARELDKYTRKHTEVSDYICSNIDSNEDQMRKEFPELFELVDIVNGTIVSIGTHPCGIVTSPVEVDEWFGTCRISTCKNPVSQIYMKEIDALNFVKLDLLGLDTIEIINNTCKDAKIERLTPDNICTFDMNVWKSMRDDTCSIFQWEGNTGDTYIKKLMSDETLNKFSEILDTPIEELDLLTLLTIGNSAIRPAGASYRDDLANAIVKKSGSAAIDDFLKPTFGYLVFQCQIIDFLNKYCGFTMGEADIVRRHFAKKTGTEEDIPVIENGGYLDKNKKGHYIKGFVQTMIDDYGQSEEEARESITAFLQVIIDASRYLFSNNHSCPYSLEGYVCGWLRYYYPLEFLTNSLNVNVGKDEKTQKLIEYAISRGITIENPKYGYSKGEYFFNKDTNSIYKGIGSIKYINNDIGNELYDMRDIEFNTFTDLLIYLTENTQIGKRQIEPLIKINYFSKFGKNKKLDVIYEKFQNRYKKTHIDKTKEVRKQEMYEFENSLENKSYTLKEQYKFEIELLGYPLTKLPQAPNNVYVISEYDDKYGIKLKCYNINNGSTTKMTMYKDDWKLTPIGKGSIIKYDTYMVKKNGDFRLKNYTIL